MDIFVSVLLVMSLLFLSCALFVDDLRIDVYIIRIFLYIFILLTALYVFLTGKTFSMLSGIILFLLMWNKMEDIEKER